MFKQQLKLQKLVKILHQTQSRMKKQKLQLNLKTYTSISLL